MSRVHKIYHSFLISVFFWQLIMIQKVNSFGISVDKENIELQIKDYFEYLNVLEYTNKGMIKDRKVAQLKKGVTEICDLKRAQLLTLCRRIAKSEMYKNSKFKLARVKRFLPLCYPQYVKLSNESKKRLLLMVTCPYIKKRYLSESNENELLSSRPGTLFVSGNVGVNSALVFISRRRNEEIFCEPYGHVTDIDMTALKKIQKFEKEALEAIDELSAETNDVSIPTKDSEEIALLDSAERPLYFKDLL